MAQALASFKTRYNEFPPSRIILNENSYYDTSDQTTLDQVQFLTTSPVPFSPIGDNDTNSGNPGHPGVLNPTYVSSGVYDPAKDLTYGELSERSLRYLRKFFPRAPFHTGKLSGASGTFFDFNGSGAPEYRPILLQGHECLVFFLGGIPSQVSGVYGMTGFGNNPQNPFIDEGKAPNRLRPLFEFKGDRLIDDDGDGIPGYVDPLGTRDAGRYYAYFSSYGGGGYDPNDVNFALEDDMIPRPFRVSFKNTFFVPSPAPNPYTSTPAAPGYPTVGKTASYQNNESYQIISAGGDRLYGYAGQYTTSAGQTPLPLDPPAPSDPSYRIREGDNLSNFTSSRLE
jgi:hypothetical protein